jgi:hypothetical protein
MRFLSWPPRALQVTQNSNGSPIKSGGKEYMVCR